ncbi:MAG: mechanosensitive ion channel [Gallionellaceae bacterium]|nr:mechanosensitive ion channel [Gallionellaceae bacterium]
MNPTVPTEPPVENLVDALLSDLSNTVLLTQATIILAALVLAWFGVRQLLRRFPDESRAAWHINEWPRFLVPMLALMQILLVRPLLHHSQTVHLLNLAEPLLMSMFTIQLSFFFLRSIFNPGPGLRAVERVVSWLVWGAVALHIMGYLTPMIESLDAIGFDLGKQHISLYTALIGLLSVIITLITALSVGRLIENRLIAGSNLNPNIKLAVSKIIRSLLLVVAVLVALPLVGIDITVLSVFGGALGVGLGLGLQKIASNYFSGFTLLLEQSIRIGDMVTVDGRFGEVKEIATRYTVIRGRDGTEYILPNESLITSPVINHTLADRENRIGIPVQVAYGADLNKVREIMLTAAAKHPRVISTQEPRVLLTGFGDNGINMELRIWMMDPEEGLGRLKSDINWAIWEAFQREGIEIPFPQRVVHMAQNSL